ncbi:MAG: MaoC family dehydratase N-terminal domain-containing protein [Neomegalonema sp.]|nr:MaoC family dehydratase N-terminal domain-containing protein [Neomegalonema sp.]
MEYSAVKNRAFAPISEVCTPDRALLYHLAIGFGAEDLAQVWEERLRSAFPTMAFVLAHQGGWMADPGSGIDYTRVVHGEQRLLMLAPIEIGAALSGQARVTHVVDKGAGKGAVVQVENRLTDASGREIARVTQTNFCRGDGGLSQSDPAPEPLAVLPERAPDAEITLSLPQNAAALYRLTGDRNPLHIDPERATAAGFKRPILHGLCTLGHAARALCQRSGRGLSALDTRFSSIVYPGERLLLEIWDEADGAAFRARAPERDAVVLDRGWIGF